MVPIRRIRGSVCKLKHRRFKLSIKNHLFTVRMSEHWYRLLREFVESPFLEIFKSHLSSLL